MKNRKATETKAASPLRGGKEQRPRGQRARSKARTTQHGQANKGQHEEPNRENKGNTRQKGPHTQGHGGDRAEQCESGPAGQAGSEKKVWQKGRGTNRGAPKAGSKPWRGQPAKEIMKIS